MKIIPCFYLTHILCYVSCYIYLKLAFVSLSTFHSLHYDNITKLAATISVQFLPELLLLVGPPVGGEGAGPAQGGPRAVPQPALALPRLLAAAEHVQVAPQQQLSLVDVQDVGVVQEPVILVLLILATTGHIPQSSGSD